MDDYKMNSDELKAIWSLGIVFFLRMLGMFMALPVLTTYGIEFQDANEILIGLAIGIYGLMQAGFQIPLGFFSDRIGRKPLIIGGMIVFMIGSIISALSYSIWGVIFGRALQGSGAISSVIMAFLSELIREQNRTKSMVFLGASFGIAFIISMLLGQVITKFFGLHAIFWIIALLAAMGIFLTLWIVPDSRSYIINRETKIVKSYLGKVLLEPNILKLNLSTIYLHFLLMSNLVALPKQLTAANFPISQHWKVYIITMFISFISTIPFIIYAEVKRCVKRTFILCIFLLLNAEIVFWIFSPYPYFYKIIVGMQIFFLAFSIMEALLPSMLSKSSPVGYKGTVMGMYSTSQCLGIATGSIFSGWMLDFFGLQTIFLIGILLTITWLLVASSIKEPPYLISLCIRIPDDIQLDKVLTHLKNKAGINEMLIISEERNLYVKIDSTVTNRFEIEHIIKNKQSCTL